MTNRYGWTLLMTAAWLGKDEVLEFLIQRGANLDVKSRSGFTALMYAVLGSRLKCTQILF